MKRLSLILALSYLAGLAAVRAAQPIAYVLLPGSTITRYSGGTPAAGAVVNEHGCSIEQLVPCEGPTSGSTWKNHGEYVLAVARAAASFHSAGLITTKEKRAIIRAAIQSDCGRR